MRKVLMIVAGFGLALSGVSQNLPDHVDFKEGFYAVKISPQGNRIISKTGSMSVYDTETGETFVYTDCLMGYGNTITDNGIVVGDAGDLAAIFYEGETILPEALLPYRSSQLNALTPDASRVVGMINNSNDDDVAYVGFVADLNPDFSITNITPLPYPKLDLFGSAPQFTTAVWISDDGKTVIGQVLDWRGFYCYPIVYKEDESGQWSYSLPSESLFNPTKIDIPANPWINKPEMPVAENFMSGLMLQAYRMKYQEYLQGKVTEMPIPEDYMTDEQYAAYEKAVNDYNEWFYGNTQRINQYLEIYDNVLATSPTFSLNEMALHPSGEYFMTQGGTIDFSGEMDGAIYQFSDKDLIDIWKGPDKNLYPCQILADGTLVASLPMMDVPTSYIVLPDTKEFVSIPRYLENNYPEIATWLTTTFPGGSGLVSISSDKSVMAGALIPGQYAFYDEDTDPYYSTYIISGLTAGVEQIAIEPEEGVFKVYNFQGVKVLETKEVSLMESLSPGLYIVNGKKVFISR